MPGITAAAFISGNIDTDFTFVIESPLLVTISFAANGTGQGAGILIVHGYTTYSRLRFEFIAGDKSSQGDKERDEIKPAPAARGGTAIFSKRLELMKEEAARLGAIVHVEFAQNWNIRPCIGCMKCRSAKNCVLPEDDSQRVLPLIQDCAALIIGSPTYWGNMPVPLHKGKKAVFVCTSSTPWPFNVLMGQTGGVVRSIKNSYICTFTNQV